MNEAMAKLTTFTRTTLTPMPAAERSLARTASIAEPSDAGPQPGDAERDEHERDQAQQAELEPGERLAGSDAEVDAEQRRWLHRAAGRVPTIWLLRNHTASIA